MKKKMIVSLPEDMWILIFTYLPLCSIHNLRCVSKVWLSILTNPNFINKWIHFHTTNKSLPWVQFHTFGASYDIKFRYAYPPDLHSQFISRYGHGLSFRFIDLSPIDDQLGPLISSNGLLLGFSIYSSNIRKKLHVCNPLTRKWVSLPEPPISCRSDLTGFWCDSTNSSPSHYKVVCIPKFVTPSKKFNVEIFSSDLGRWRIRQVSCSQDVALHLPVVRNAVTHNGVMYWVVQDNKLLAYNLNHNSVTDGEHQCRLINMPDEDLDDRLCRVGIRGILGESEGCICYARIKLRGKIRGKNQLVLCVWVLYEEDNWQLWHNEVELHNDMVSRKCWVEDLLVLGFNPFDRDVVLLGCKNYVWEFNIRTKQFVQLCYPSFFANSSLTKHDKVRMNVQFPLQLMPTVLPQPSWDPVKSR